MSLIHLAVLRAKAQSSCTASLQLTDKQLQAQHCWSVGKDLHGGNSKVRIFGGRLWSYQVLKNEIICSLASQTGHSNLKSVSNLGLRLISLAGTRGMAMVLNSQSATKSSNICEVPKCQRVQKTCPGESN